MSSYCSAVDNYIKEQEQFSVELDKDIKVIELFAGVGGFRIGLERASEQFKTVWSSQWEPSTKKQDASEIYVKRFGADGHSNENVCTVGVERIPEADMVVGGFPCLTGDTLVLTKRGLIQLVDIQPNDVVLTHDGTYQNVSRVFDQGIKETFKIKGYGFDSIIATGNHKFYVRVKSVRYTHTQRIKEFSKPNWMSVSEIQNAKPNSIYLGSVVNTNAIMPSWNGIDIFVNATTAKHINELDVNDSQLWYLAGLYLGNGWLHKNPYQSETSHPYDNVIICGNKAKFDFYANKIDRAKNHYTTVFDKTVFKMIFSSVELTSFMKQFGSGASKKHIPDFMFDAPIPVLKAFLDGYLDTDGHKWTNGIAFTTISRELAYGIMHIVEKVYKCPCNLYKHISTGTHTIQGRVVNESDYYQVKCSLHNTRISAFYENGYIWYPVRSVETNGEEHVYDIEVENAHSFVANHMITHNCQDYSVASTLNRSGGIEGKKGVLWWEIYRILKDSEHKPSYCIFENVDRLLKSPAKQRGRDFAIILASLANLGYDVEWRVINAADYGMPQRRRRTYMVAYKNDEKLAAKIRSQVPETVIFAGVIGAAFPSSKSEKGKFNKFSLDTDLVTVSNEFNKGKKTSPFFSAGVLRGREVTTVDVVPQYDGTRITLGDILVDEKDVPESFFIKDTEMPRWQYLKGGKSEKRVTADGFEYNYSEGPMAFPDSPEKPSRTIITGEGGTAPSRFKHVIQTPSGRYRRLMPIELERLNMFPDNHTEGVSDIKRAFLMGNALVTGIVSGIGRSLALFVGHD